MSMTSSQWYVKTRFSNNDSYSKLICDIIQMVDSRLLLNHIPEAVSFI